VWRGTGGDKKEYQQILKFRYAGFSLIKYGVFPIDNAWGREYL
jgi:hypothetical protein